MNKQAVWHGGLFLAILAAAAYVRYPLVFLGHPFYNSDTAILDLMARHFLRGEWTFYYWGERYYGVLDPVLLMPLFKAFGQTIAVSGVLPFTAALIFIALFHRYVRTEGGDWIAHGATLLLALPSTMFLRYTFTTYNYAFGPCLGMALLILGRGLNEASPPRRWFSLGLCAGFSYYYFRFAMIFCLGLGVAWWVAERAGQDAAWLRAAWRGASWKAFWTERVLLQGHALHPVARGLAVTLNIAACALWVVCVPLWLHGNIDHAVGTHRLHVSFWHTLELAIRLAGAGIAVAYWRTGVSLLRAGWSRPPLRRLAMGFLIGFAPGLLGALFLQFPSSPGKIVSLPVSLANIRMVFGQILPSWVDPYPIRFLGPLAYAFLYAGMGYTVVRVLLFFRNGLRGGDALPALLVAGFLNLILGIASIELGNVSTGRYFLPFMIALPLAQLLALLSLGKHSRWLAIAAVGLMAFANAAADLRLIRQSPRGDRFEPVAESLIKRGYQAGYADYWIAYHLTAVSQERLVVAPTGDNDRYRPYLQAARAQTKTFLLSYEPVAGPAIEIKGVRYRILGQDTLNGLRVYYLLCYNFPHAE